MSTSNGTPSTPRNPRSTDQNRSVAVFREAARAAQGWPGALWVLAARMLPRRSDYDGLSRTWRGDLLAGLTVGIVALPLALGFGVSSGVGAAAGLITAVVAGFVAAVFGGSNLQVSGPTGAMTVVLLPIVARHGPESVFAVSIMAGGIVILAGLLRIGRLVTYVPWPVVEGFTAGIGIIIALQQVPLALGVPTPDGETATLVAARALRIASPEVTVPALAVVTLVIAVMIVLPRIRRSLPASLIAVVVATVVVEVAGLDVARIGAIPASLPAPSIPVLNTAQTSELFSAALAVAALAALESLLAARVADGMADDVKPTDPDRELFGQGLANVASGIFGGMPATGAIARTAVNVRSGARSRVASAFHALVLAGMMYLLAPVVSRIPLAALAGVLIVTASRMVDVRTGRAILRAGRSDALVFLVTLGATVLFDLIMAVQVGVAVAAVLALRAMARTSGVHREDVPLPAEVDSETEQRLLREHIAVYRIDGAWFFGDARRFLEELTGIADVRVVILRLSGLQVLDTSGAAALVDIITHLRDRGITVLLKGARPGQRQMIEAVGALNGIDGHEHFFDDLDEAIEHARLHVRPSGPTPETGPDDVAEQVDVEDGGDVDAGDGGDVDAGTADTDPSGSTSADPAPATGEHAAEHRTGLNGSTLAGDDSTLPDDGSTLPDDGSTLPGDVTAGQTGPSSRG